VIVVCALSSLYTALMLSHHRATPLPGAEAPTFSSRPHDADSAGPPPPSSPASRQSQSPARPTPEAQPQPEASPYRLASVTVEQNFISAVQRVGVSAAVASMLVSAFEHEIDFRRDLKRGNAVKLIFGNPDGTDDARDDGKPTDAQRADAKRDEASLPLAVRIELGERAHDVFLVRDDKGTASYRTKRTTAPEPAMARYPVSYRRISSHFAPRRLNPVTLQWRPHEGVDFAAPAGTPVYATADGKVSFAGRQGGYGNVVKLGHRRSYSTTYAHLSGFAAGLRAGGTVRRGELIGYVGSTGWSTAPHLHYEVRVNGVPRDPLSVELPRAEPVRTAQHEQFEEQTIKLAALF